ncbi:hypothetical protein [Streptomyces sp. BA2]|uniref:hypothetical protein n=1 Tax=Streptomyces sp. BA2 TaxID=436595 RepID=UPI0013238953|nr:hypothetical protein [Streptomyces sp. BA2]MWA12865.1 hypothetical protein [Streptomyces sp. BA2]
MGYTDHDHLREWLAEHGHRILDPAYSATFERYLESLPWTSSRIRWAAVPHTEIDTAPSDDPAFTEAWGSTPLGGHPFVLITYTGSEPAVLCRTEDALRDIDVLYLRAPGPRYFCGADSQDGEVTLFSEHFAEYDISGLTFHTPQ